MVVVKVGSNSFFHRSILCFFLIIFLGTVSVDPRLDNQPQQLVIRKSMLKFTTDHDKLEICKVSSPRMLLFEINSNLKKIFF
jgi:hypothetical protein